MPEYGGEKTQEPTAHRRQQARQDGHVSMSQDLGSAMLLVAATLLLMVFGGTLMERIGRQMQQHLGQVGRLEINQHDVAAKWDQTISEIGPALWPIFGLLVLVAVASNVMQVGFLFVPKKIAPDISRLSLIAGVKRIFSLSGLMRLSFGLFKVLVIGLVTIAVFYIRSDEALSVGALDVAQLANFLADLGLETALWVGIALVVLALLDFAYQRWKHEQDLRMTHQEVREELKNLQGDPQIVARRRAVQRQMVLNRIGDSVREADVVVTNPTELAVAIRYDPTSMSTPIVVAKGAGLLAQRIRRLALENDIPIVERKPLAQLLYKEVEIDQPIPDASYAAVAEVLAYVYQLKGKKMPTVPAR